MSIEGLPINGVCVIGRFVANEPIRYGKNHPTRAGEPVPGLHRLQVRVSEHEGDWPISCSYAITDRFTHEPTQAARDVEALGLVAGDRIVCRVVPEAKGQYVNFNLMGVVRLGDRPEGGAGGGSGAQPGPQPGPLGG